MRSTWRSGTLQGGATPSHTFFVRLPEQDNGPTSGLDVCSVAIDLPRRSATETRDTQLQDPELKTIIEAFEAPGSDDFMRHTARRYIMSEDVLYRYSSETDLEEPEMVPRMSAKTS